jgi:hypothetical protein
MLAFTFQKTFHFSKRFPSLSLKHTTQVCAINCNTLRATPISMPSTPHNRQIRYFGSKEGSKGQGGYKLNVKINNLLKSSENFNQIELLYKEYELDFNIVNYSFLIKKILMLGIHRNAASLKFIEQIFIDTNKRLSLEALSKNSDVYARSLANIYNFASKIIEQCVFKKNLRETGFLESIEILVSKDFEQFNEQEIAIT